jgi:predicted transcriptional regulator
MSRNVLTVRADARVVAALRSLSRLTRKPMNRLVVEALLDYLDRRSETVGAEFEAELRRLRAYRDADPDDAAAIREFAAAEASHADPVEGTPAGDLGAVRREVRDLLDA